MIKISPSLLAADFSDLKNEIISVNSADMLHLDIMDGHFVPNISFGPPLISSIRKCTNIIFDVHLMISHPLKYIPSFVKSGADYIGVHVECEDNVSECIKEIKAAGKKATVTVNPETDVKALLPYIEIADMFLIMSVHPGFGGQKFMPEVLGKADFIRRLRPDADIEIDGGINTETYRDAVNAGFNVLVAGSAVFGSSDRKSAIEHLRKL